MTNTFSNLRVEFHILQSFPVTCLNRDDLGSPKMAIVGGVPRARVSSQCWKRQVRMALHDFGVQLGIRTKNLASLIEKACVELGANEEEAKKCATTISETLTKETLLFISEAEIRAYAQFAKDQKFNLSEFKEKGLLKELIKCSKAAKITGANGLDIALFGRMVAKAPEINIEGACAFSHAISTHKVTSDIDFFTALDDFPGREQEGSAHMGALEFNSATYYRYVCLDLGQLAETLGITEESIDDMRFAISAFVKALYVAVPNARQNTQTGHCGWDYAKVFVRKGQPLQFACDKPVWFDAKSGGGYLKPSIDALADFFKSKERMSGTLFGKISEYELSNDQGSIEELIQTLESSLFHVRQ